MAKTTIVIFGGTGDLAQRKLIPALFNLRRKRRVNDEVNVVGFARALHDDGSYRDLLQEGARDLGGLEAAPEEWAGFAPLHALCLRGPGRRRGIRGVGTQAH